MAARWYMLRRDYRQYPSYPQGWATHLFIGFIGGMIGALLIPSFLEMEFAAASFLLLAASQFREVRSVERISLENMESTELVPRGTAYIEGIARVFEARNYLAIWTALVVSGASFVNIWVALGAGAVAAALLNRLMTGPHIRDIASIEIAELSFRGAVLEVAGVAISNVGLKQARETYLRRGMAAVIRPHDPNAKATLANVGQMQAIAHDVASMVGVFMDVGEQNFVPLVRREPESGMLVVSMLPADRNEASFLEAISLVPVLEGAVRKPLRSSAGQMVD